MDIDAYRFSFWWDSDRTREKVYNFSSIPDHPLTSWTLHMPFSSSNLSSFEHFEGVAASKFPTISAESAQCPLIQWLCSTHSNLGQGESIGSFRSACVLVRSKVVASVMELMELYLEGSIFLWTCVCFSYEQVVVDSTESTTFEVPLRLRLDIHAWDSMSNYNWPEICTWFEGSRLWLVNFVQIRQTKNYTKHNHTTNIIRAHNILFGQTAKLTISIASNNEFNWLVLPICFRF